LDPLGHAIEFARAGLFGHEEAGALTLNVRVDEHGARLSRSLHGRGDFGRVAEHLVRRFDDNGLSLTANAAIPSSNRNRSPRVETPISSRSSLVSRGSISAGIGRIIAERS
jgi:hypothetical protein